MFLNIIFLDARTCFAEDWFLSQNSAKPTLGVWGLAPKKRVARRSKGLFAEKWLLRL
jgi:hypothetical protein